MSDRLLPELSDGDAVHGLYQELERLGTDIPGGLIVAGKPFGFKARHPAQRTVRVVAAGRLRGGVQHDESAHLVAELRTAADGREIRRRALAYSFAGAFRVQLDVTAVSRDLVGRLDARRIDDIELPAIDAVLNTLGTPPNA